MTVPFVFEYVVFILFNHPRRATTYLHCRALLALFEPHRSRIGAQSVTAGRHGRRSATNRSPSVRCGASWHSIDTPIAPVVYLLVDTRCTNRGRSERYHLQHYPPLPPLPQNPEKTAREKKVEVGGSFSPAACLPPFGCLPAYPPHLINHYVYF